MNLIPVLVISIILFSITLLLHLADKLLIKYGKCKITIEREGKKEEFEVQGGDKLLSYLIEHKIPITASCGGRGSCGYCKVNIKKGADDWLPTEEIFITQEEKKQGVHLACQVKVKEDIELFVPDYLSVVRNIVKNKTYDETLKWEFSIVGHKKEFLEYKKIKFSKQEKNDVYQKIQEYKEKKGALIPLLQYVNNKFNFLPEFFLAKISKEFNVPLSVIVRVATFYNSFSLKPKGKHIISVCLGTACHVKGASDILFRFEKELGIKNGSTTSDLLFSLSAVRCLGCCGLAPVVKVDDKVYGKFSSKDVPKLLNEYSKKGK